MTTTPKSRQRQWQLRQKAKGKCIICGKPKATGNKNHCAFHALDNKLRSQKSRFERETKGKTST